MPETRALFPCGRPSYPKENPATGEHGGVPGPMLWGSEYSTLGPLGQVFRNVAVLKNQRAILFKYAAPLRS